LREPEAKDQESDVRSQTPKSKGRAQFCRRQTRIGRGRASLRFEFATCIVIQLSKSAEADPQMAFLGRPRRNMSSFKLVKHTVYEECCNKKLYANPEVGVLHRESWELSEAVTPILKQGCNWANKPAAVFDVVLPEVCLCRSVSQTRPALSMTVQIDACSLSP
jgi:hypothetical protein